MRDRRAGLLMNSALAVMAICAIVPTAAYAQSTAASPAPQAPDVASPETNPAPAAQAPAAEAPASDIVVTGTRIVRNGFEAPTPVSVVTSAQLQQAAPTNVADYVNQLPALQGSESQHTPRGNVGTSTAGANILNLRSLGASRTLVLLNGRRVTPSNLQGTTDINTLPSSLVKRIDVVTGGASAAWGSDAVAGVVNFVLDTDFSGIKGSVQKGITANGDAPSTTADLSFGHKFADGRGHIILSGSYSKSGAAYYAQSDWFKAYKIVPNPTATATNGQPARLIVPWTSLNITANGLVASGPLKGYYFDDRGNLAGTNFAFQPIISSIYAGGDPTAYRNLYDEAQYGQSSVPIEQGSVYGRLSYDLTDNLKAYVDGSWSQAKAAATIATLFRTGTASVAIDNAYLPAAVRTAMTTAGVRTIPLSTANPSFGPLVGTTNRRNVRVIGGLEGKIGSNWSWNASYQYGRSNIASIGKNDPIIANYNAAIDSVIGANGQIVCRSTIANPTNGCVPLNPLGSQPLTSAQRAYLLGNSIQHLTYRQDVATANLNGDLFQLPAGAVSLATGFEYRREHAVATSDALSQGNAFFAGNYKPFQGTYNVKEGFAELAIPVLKNMAFAKALDLNVAGRITNYSTSGTVKTWKAGLTYKPIDDIEFRITRSRDIRAPNLNELFLGGSVTTQNVFDPQNGNANVSMLQTTRGNSALKPEKADTLTGGIVLRPSFLPGFGLSVDYYDIKIKSAITTNSSQIVVNQCAAGDAPSCALITRNAAGIITGVTILPFNAQREVARGLDIEGSYRHSLGAGTIELRGLANYINKLTIYSPGGVINRAGEVGDNSGAAEGQPNWRGLLTATYTQGGFTGQLKGRFISAAKIEADWGPLQIDRNHVSAVAYLDAYVAQKIKAWDGHIELFAAADNILNKKPPIIANQDNANVLGSGTNPLIYDMLGAAVRFGARFQF